MLIVRGFDRDIIQLNHIASAEQMKMQRVFEIIQGATHLFEEPGDWKEWLNSRANGSSDIFLKTSKPLRKVQRFSR
jgi:hypothetical protein